MSIDLQRLYETESKWLNLFSDGEQWPVERFIGQHIGILGKSGAGKSVTNAVLMEEFTSTGIIQCIIDTEGDYYSLKSWRPHKYKVYNKFRVLRQWTVPAKRDKKGRVIAPARVEQKEEWNYRIFDEVCDTLLGEGVDGSKVNRSSVIVLLDKYSKDDRLEIIYQIIKRLWEGRIRPAERREAIAVLLDEAHEKVPQGRAAHKALLILLEDIAKQGRKFGLSLLLSSQRPAEVNKNALAQCHMLICLKVDEHLDVEAYVLRLPLEATAQETRSRIWGECRYFVPGRCYFRYPTNDPYDSGIRVKQMRWRYSKHTTQTPGVESLVSW